MPVYLKPQFTDSVQDKYLLPATPDEELNIGRDDSCGIVIPSNGNDGISRSHCTIKYIQELGFVLGDNSKNGTILITEASDPIDIFSMPRKEVQVKIGDTIAIPSQPQVKWQFKIEDANRTKDWIKPKTLKPEMQYIVNLDRKILCYGFRDQIWDVSDTRELRAQTVNLLIFMAEKNLKCRGETICDRDEMIKAVWGNAGGSEEDLRKLIKEVRDKVKDENLIETKKGMGYILHAKGFRAH